jgi:hypothetical protein
MDDRFSRLAVILHAVHGMNVPRTFIGIELDLAAASDVLQAQAYHTSQSIIMFKFVLTRLL